jgi:galactose-1-phosphate uridylyltransferase
LVEESYETYKERKMSIQPPKQALTEVEQKAEEIKKLARRITMLMRDLEAYSLDMVLYSKALSQGKFPMTEVVKYENGITSAITELTRIKKAWVELMGGNDAVK